MLEKLKAVYGVYSLNEFEKALIYVKQAWLLSKTSQRFDRLTAINGKYEKQTLVNLKAIWPPGIAYSVVENWIYPRESSLMEVE